jgi:hypothetical protein
MVADMWRSNDKLLPPYLRKAKVSDKTRQESHPGQQMFLTDTRMAGSEEEDLRAVSGGVCHVGLAITDRH